MKDKVWAVAQLRHLYKLMVSGQVEDAKQAAEGLLGPAIKALEQEESAKWRGVVDGYPWRDRTCRGCGSESCFCHTL